MVFLRTLASIGLAFALPLAAQAANPTIEGLPTAGVVPNVEARIPAAKALILPLTAYADDGQRVTFTVTTSNPKIMARVRSGDPLLRLHIEHPGNGVDDPTDPEYHGDLVFQLFRAMAPNAADYIAGFAQSGFYDDTTTAGDWTAITTTHEGDNATPEVQQYTPPVRTNYRLRMGTTSVTKTLAPTATPDEVKTALNALAAVTTAGGVSSVVADSSGHYVITFTTNANQTTLEIVQQGAIFHRIADLNDDKDPSTPALDSDFIFQGGDPLGTGSGGPGFTFDNEFNPAVIFVGRGQLAMANSGYNQTTLKGSNGSQFFITDAQPRHLDFNHTIFGQLTHGWDVLPKMKATPRNSSDIPLKTVKITQAEIVGQFKDGTKSYNDAVLVLSATVVGTATITVTATDESGRKTTQAFTAQSVRDEINDPPFIQPLANRVALPSRILNMPFKTVDLEYDYVSVGQGLLNNGTSTNVKGGSALTSSNVFSVQGNPSYTATAGTPAGPFLGALSGALAATQFDPARREVDGSRDTDDFITVNVAVGDKDIKPQPLQVVTAPGVPLSSAIVARFQDTDVQGSAADFSAKINWGDGFAVTDAGVVARDGVTGTYGTFRVTGSHTYSRAGVYPVIVTISGSKGLSQQIRSTAVVTTDPIVVSTGERQLAGARWMNREIGRFSDTAPAAATTYSTTIDWGDGAVSPGIVRALGGGTFAVYGTHLYRDPEDFSYSIRVRKTVASTTQEATSWGRMEVRGFIAQQHLPPFDQSHLVAALSPVAVDKNSSNSATKPLKETEGSQTYLNYTLLVINTGNRASRPATLTLYLSPDTVANPTPVKDQFGNVTRAADRYVEWGPPINAASPLRRKTVSIPALPPGGARQYFFEKSKLGDYRMRLPAGETGTGYNIVMNVEWPEPLAHLEPISFSAVAGPIQGIIVTPRVVQTSEIGTTGTFQVRLDKRPNADVTIPLTTVAGDGSADTTEGDLDRTQIVFTPNNWNVPQTVTVTGKRDSVLPTTGSTSTPNAADGTATYFVLLNPAVSADPLFNNLVGPYVAVTNADIDSNIKVSTTSLTTTEAATTGTTTPAHTATFNLSLARTPVAPVSIQIFVGDTSEGEIILPGDTDPVPDGEDVVVTFTQDDIDQGHLAKTITVRGKDDNASDGDVSYNIAFEATSDDPQFNGITPARITVKNIDKASSTSSN